MVCLKHLDCVFFFQNKFFHIGVNDQFKPFQAHAEWYTASFWSCVFRENWKLLNNFGFSSKYWMLVLMPSGDPASWCSEKVRALEKLCWGPKARPPIGPRSRISRQFAVSMPAAPSWLAALLAGGRGTTLHRFNPPLVARDLLHRRRSALMANWEKGGTGQCGMGRGSPPSTSATSIVISSHQPLKPPPASPSHYHFQYQF